MTRTLPTILLVASLGIEPTLASAMHPLATDDAGTVGAGTLELELAADAGQPVGHDGHFGVGLAVHAGLAATVDVGVGWSYEAHGVDGTWELGSGSPVVDLKWGLWDALGPRPGVALRLDYAAPSGRGRSFTGHELGAVAVVSWALPRLEVHSNVGVVASGLGSSERGVGLTTSVMTVWPVSDALGLAVEAVGGASPADGFRSVESMAGVVWEPAAGRVLSAGAGPAWDATEGLGWIATVGFTLSIDSL